jgi:hypothetical protein
LHKIEIFGLSLRSFRFNLRDIFCRTLLYILEVPVRKHIFLGSISSLNRFLHNIGFTFKATYSRKRLMELGHVAIARVQFVRSFMQNLNAQNSLQCVYLDETWIFENGPVHRSWQDDSFKSIKNSGTLKGKDKLKYHFR